MEDDNDSADGPYAVFQLLCSDVWLKILEKLSDDPRNMIHMCSTSPQIYNLLHVYKINGEHSGEGACRLQEVLPLILKWLSSTSILNMRLVCKRTKKVVDHVMEETERVNRFENLGLFPRLLPPSADESYEWRNIKLPLYLFRAKSLRSFQEMEDFEQLLLTEEVEHGANPLLTKQLEIIVPDSRFEERRRENIAEEELEELREEHAVINQRVCHFLTRIPAHFIRYLTNKLCTVAEDETYNIIRQVLETLPNIYHLTISRKTLFLYSGDLPVHPIPLPPSQGLESIAVEGYWKSADFLGQVEAQYGDQLKMLKLAIERDLDDWDLDEDNWDRQEAPPDPNLERVYNFPRLMEMDWIAPGYMFENYFLNIVAPQLKSLNLELDIGMHQVEDLIRLVLHFPTLTEMSLKYEEEAFGTNLATPMDELNLHQERHPNLKKLTLVEIPRVSNIPMIFYVKLCPALQVIKVQEDHGEDEPRATEDQFSDSDFFLLYEERFEESEIWLQAPKLQMVIYIDTDFDEPEEFVCKIPLVNIDPPAPV